MADTVKAQMNTRGKEKEKSALLASVIQDIFRDKRFIDLVEERVNKQLADIRETIDTQQARIFDLEIVTDSKSREIVNVQNLLEIQQEQIKSLQRKLDQQEQYSRRNCLLFFGFEERSEEDTDDIILQVANEVLQVDLSKDDLERTHRNGSRQKHQEKNLPRPIIAKFTSYRKRQEVISKRRKLAGKRKSIQEDLTKANQDLLAHVRTSEKVKAAWTRDGRILMTDKNNKKHLILCKDDLRKFWSLVRVGTFWTKWVTFSFNYFFPHLTKIFVTYFVITVY